MLTGLLKSRGERPEGESDGKEDAEETPSIVPDPEALAESSDDLSEPESETSTDRGKRSRNNAALRKKAVQAKQAQKDAEAGAREAAAKLQKASDKAKKAEKEEEKRLVERIADLGREFRRQYNAMRTYPIGQDRFLNTIWWLDGCGTVELVGSDGEIVYGTGRLYIQAPKQEAIDRHMAIEELTLEEVQEKHEQGEPIGEPLEDGEWATIDTVKQVSSKMMFIPISDLKDRSIHSWSCT
jgi:bromodomain adjacent to zinc finger domain protein 1A